MNFLIWILFPNQGEWQRIRKLILTVGFSLTFLFSVTGVASATDKLIKNVLNEKGEFSCLSQAEEILFGFVNEYRSKNNLPMISNSRSLNKVARIHAIDLVENRPELATDSRGLACNLHSWSNKGFWSPVCYTSDHAYLVKMLSKPKEITQYEYGDVAYENVYWTSVPEVFPYRALDAWKKSPAHNMVILEIGKWNGSKWNALGVGVYKNVATIWFGAMPDPLGPLPVCDPKWPK